MKIIFIVLMTMFTVPLLAQPFVTVGSSFYYPQDSYVRQTDTWSINAELSAGFQDGRYGLTLSGNVPVRTDLRSLQRFSFDAYPTNWLVFSIGFSRTDFTEPGFTDPVETNSLGLMTGLAFEFALSEHLDIGVKGLHDFHGADIEEQYEWLGGTTASTYLKISF